MKQLVFILLLSLSSTSYADWTMGDTGRQALYLGTLVADYGQTRYIAMNCSDYIELNPMLGKCPSLSKVTQHFVVMGILHTGVAMMLPRRYRIFYQFGTTLMQIGYLVNNHQLGIRTNFRVNF